MVYIGLDMHKKFSYITGINSDGETLFQEKLYHHNGDIKEFFNQFKEPVSVAMEATSNWYWLYDLLEGENISVSLAHPLKTKAIASSKIKTDKIDSKILGHLLRSSLIPCSYIADKTTRLNRERLRYRASLVKIQTSLKNRIHSILAKNNITHSFSDLFGKEGRSFLKDLQLDPVYKEAISGYLDLLENIKSKIERVTKKIKATVQQDIQANLLDTIPGAGHYSSLLILSEIGDINRFPNARCLCSYAGLVPSTYSSGNYTYHGKITKQGSRWLRWIAIEVALKVIDSPGPLRGFYLKISNAKGNKIARTATARKLLKVIYYMLKNNKDYSTTIAKMQQDCRQARLYTWSKYDR